MIGTNRLLNIIYVDVFLSKYYVMLDGNHMENKNESLYF